MLKARDIMTSQIVTVRPDCTIREAIEVLLDKRITGLPVTSADGHLVGIVTEFALLAIAYDNQITEEPVSNHMTTDVLTIDAEAPLSRAADLCIAHRVRRVPVMENGRLVGLVSRGDVLRAVYEEQTVVAS